MGAPAAQAIYPQRGATAEWTNAQARVRYGLQQFTVHGLTRITSVMLLVAVTHNPLRCLALLASAMGPAAAPGPGWAPTNAPTADRQPARGTGTTRPGGARGSTDAAPGRRWHKFTRSQDDNRRSISDKLLLRRGPAGKSV